MKEKFTLEQFIKKEIHQKEHSFNEGLWSKLDQQLIPVRDAYHKKERRRALIFWLPLGALLVGGVIGTGVYYYNSNNVTKKISTVEKTTTLKNEITEKQNSISSTPLNNAITIEENKKSNTISKATANNSLSSLTDTDDYVINDNVIATHKTLRKTKRSSSVKNINDASTETSTTEAVIIDTNPVTAEVNSSKEATPSITAQVPAKEDSKATTPVLTTIAASKDAKTNTTNAKIKGENTTTPMEYYVLGGVNFSSPFNKSGYFGGLLLEKQIKDKRLFFGVKVAYNNLQHQLVASKNATVFPQTTDAMINRMTTIQVPFGYQFKLSKGSIAKATLLNVGFEPTLITGIQTIYYEDNGVPGGPRTPVVNSPLLSNAINRFNVSFIAGIRKQLNSKIGFNINAGYGLIDITDKQYYNKTTSNNNLKYIQLGLHYKLR